MCGIAGFYSFNARIPAHSLYQMSDAIRHRGPDDEGYALVSPQGDSIYASGNDSLPFFKNRHRNISEYFGEKARVGLAHRRFSIVDVGPGGHQPWVDCVTENILVFNGEIYNFLELKHELIALGAGPFISHSDTEVLSVAYQTWGVNCFQKLNGFWAVAIYDKKNNQLVLSRDRFGKKPLYLFFNQDGFYFSSEIRSLLKGIPAGSLPRKVNIEAAYLYLLHDRRNTFQDSLFEGVEQLPNASVMSVDLSTAKREVQTYWQLPTQRLSPGEISLGDATEQLKEHIHSAVKLRLRSDVPFEANLSGGLDSGAIVAHASQILSGGRPLTTHTIRYKNDSSLDESAPAREIANFCGTNHKEILISPEDAWENLDSLIDKVEEPVHSMASYVQWLAWKAIADEGYKVILHGSANDELMLGYSYLAQIEDISRINRFHFPLRMQEKSVFSYKNMGRIAKWCLQGKVFPQLSAPFGLSHSSCQASHRSLFQSDFIRQSEGIEYKLSHYIEAANSSGASRMFADFDKLRIPYWCNFMDKSMMSIPIEVRMPFLDHNLVEYAFQLPVSYHYRDGVTKYLLRKSLNRMLPESIVWNKVKTGFSVPKRQWINNHKRYFAEVFDNTSMKEIIDLGVLKKDFDILPVDYLWRIINFSKWMQRFNVSI